MEQKSSPEFNALALSLKLITLFAGMMLSLVGLAAAAFLISPAAPVNWRHPLMTAFAVLGMLLFAAAHGLFHAQVSEKKLLAAHGQGGAHGLALRLQTAFILAFALCEGVIVMGLLAALLTGSRDAVPPFLIAAMINLVLFFPSPGRLKSIAGPVLRRAQMTPGSGDVR